MTDEPLLTTDKVAELIQQKLGAPCPPVGSRRIATRGAVRSLPRNTVAAFSTPRRGAELWPDANRTA